MTKDDIIQIRTDLKLYKRQLADKKAGNFNHAQALASHRTANITNAVYLIEKKEMEREELKRIPVK